MADGGRRPEGKRTREGSAMRRLAWAVVGVGAYLAAKYVFGF